MKIAIASLIVGVFAFTFLNCNDDPDQDAQLPIDECCEDTIPDTDSCFRDSISGTDLSSPAITNNLSSQLKKIVLPAGFKIEVFGNAKNARQLAVTPSGIVFVGTQSEGSVYAFQDVDCDGKADKRWRIASNLRGPNGVAFRDGDLYVAEVHRIIRYGNVISRLNNVPAAEVVKELPTLGEVDHHSHRYLSFGPDGKLYVTIGTPCVDNNITENCISEPFGTIIRMNPDGSGMEIYAKGIRNSVGMAWHPESKTCWFTDAGDDFKVNGKAPSCELNEVKQLEEHFGFPYCHQGDIPHPDIGEASCAQFSPPAIKFGDQTTPLGLSFYTGSMFPVDYNHQLLVALKGSWSRKPLVGHEIVLVRMNHGQAEGFETFASGWLDNANASNSGEGSWGRPVDVVVHMDGSVLVSDDKAGAVYRISYQKE